MQIKARFSFPTLAILTIGAIFSTPLGIYFLYLSINASVFAFMTLSMGGFFTFLGIQSAVALSTQLIVDKKNICLNNFINKKSFLINNLAGYLEVRVAKPKKHKKRYYSSRYKKDDNTRLYIYFKNNQPLRLDPHLWAIEDYQDIIAFLNQHTKRLSREKSFPIIKQLQKETLNHAVRIGYGIAIFSLIGMISFGCLPDHIWLIFSPLLLFGLGMAFYNRYLNKMTYVTLTDYLKRTRK